MKVDLNNKVAIVTGGAGGIGSAIAKEFAKNGAYIYLCDVKEVMKTARLWSKML